MSITFNKKSQLLQDSTIKTSMPVIHLIGAIKSGAIDYSNVANANKLGVEVSVHLFLDDILIQGVSIIFFYFRMP